MALKSHFDLNEPKKLMDYIIYVSTAVRPMSDSELSNILAASRKNNVSRGITGILIYRYSAEENVGSFIQLLEGDKTAVMDTYNHIVKDSRHHSKIVLEEGQTESRQFPDWAMGFKNIDAVDLRAVPGFTNLGKDSFDSDYFKNSRRTARETLEFFYDAD
jgi:hypothetical protein